MAASENRTRYYAAFFLLANLLRPTVQFSDSPRVEPFWFSPRMPNSGDSIRAMCHVSKGQLPLSVVWLHNGENIKRQNVEIKTMDEVTASLKISDIDIEDIGNYTCAATNVAGIDSFTAVLKFDGPPKWVILPPDHSDVLVGKTAILHCAATGSPVPSRIWWKEDFSDNMSELPRNDARKRVWDNGTLIIHDVSQSDSGKYACVVDNGVGEKLKAVVTLRVHEPPVMITEFQSITSKKGDMTKIKCRAKGESPIFWEWIKDNQQVTPQGERFETSEEQKPGFVSSELVIRETRTQDAGLYLCKAKNKFGDASITLQLTVLEPPEAPLGIKIIENGSRFARLSWVPSRSGNSPVLRYKVRFWTNDGKGRRLQEIETPTDTNIILDTLHPGVRYNVVVAAENLVGSGPPSSPIEFVTKEEEPSGPPTDITIQADDSSVLKITWKPPPKELWNGRLNNYQIGYRKHGTELAYRFETVGVHHDSKQQEMKVTGLDPATRYDIIVRAINAAGTGPWSPESLAYTSRGDHPRVPSMKITSATSHSLQLEWDVPGINNQDSVKQFFLQYGKAGKMNQKVHIPGSKRTLLLRGLEDKVRYELRMASCNEHGQSHFSPTVTETTMELLQEAMTQETEATPFYLRLYFIVPVAVSVTVVVSTLVVAWACVARTKALEAASHLLREPVYEYKVPVVQRYQTNTLPGRKPQPGVALEEAYDLPWDMTLGTDGNYTRLGEERRSMGTVRADHNRRSR